MEQRCARILIIDDEEDICRYTRSMLQRTGRFEASATTDSKEGLALARKEPPDLILLDVNMPGMDGGDVASALAENDRTKDIPILFITALMKKAEESGESVGKHYYLAKPVNPTELVEKIDTILKHSLK
ncbi:MAG: response regulator [Deltaproteobacteria bacterium]